MADIETLANELIELCIDNDIEVDRYFPLLNEQSRAALSGIYESLPEDGIPEERCNQLLSDTDFLSLPGESIPFY